MLETRRLVFNFIDKEGSVRTEDQHETDKEEHNLVINILLPF